MRGALSDGKRRRVARPMAVVAGSVLLWLACGTGGALAAEELHPFVSSFGRSAGETFSDPNGIAVDEASGDVYVADIGADAVYKFSGDGEPADFASTGTNELTGTKTAPGSFSFPSDRGTPAALAIDNSSDPADPSRGDLYVLDAGKGVIDKFSPDGTYLAQITGPFEEGPVGIAVMANGDLDVAVRAQSREGQRLNETVDLFNNALENELSKRQEEASQGTEAKYDTRAAAKVLEYGFAASPNGRDYYNAFPCGCIEKFGGALTALGVVDAGPSDVAMAVDPRSGHLYVDDQSSVVEWDTGELDGYDYSPESDEGMPTAALVSTFGLTQLSPSLPEQGGLAVNGRTGTVYVSNPSDGKVYVFASMAPAVAAQSAADVTRTGAALQGTVDPRGASVTSCQFEYRTAPKGGAGQYSFAIPVGSFTHTVPCAQSPGDIGSGVAPVPVSAEISGLTAGTLYYFRLIVGSTGGNGESAGMVATESAGFGVSSLGVSFVNQDGTPDTQAGSHPYEMVTTFSFNLQTAQTLPYADSPYTLRPVGNAKDIILTLPPGLVGDPGATAKKCKLTELEYNAAEAAEEGNGFYNVNEEYNTKCPHESKVGELYLETGGYGTGSFDLYNMVPPRGVADQLGTRVIFPDAFINVSPEAGGQYPLRSESLDIPAIVPLYRIRASIRGVVGTKSARKPFLTLPSGCTGPLWSSISVDSYQDPGHYVGTKEPTRNASGEEVRLSGCSKLTFPTAITAAPDVSDTSSSSGLTVGVHVPQTAAFNPEGLAESTLRDTTVALPPGVTINPAGADGLQACSESLAGFTGFAELNAEFESGTKWATFSSTSLESLQPGASLCPDGSKIGTVAITTPLLPNPLEGAVYLASQDANPFDSLLAMYMLVEDPISGTTIKLAGEVRLCEAAGEVLEGRTCEAPGQIITTFENTPDLPFEDLELHFFGGERAPLSTPAHCGTYTTRAWFTPWDGNSPVEATSQFDIEHGPNSGPCPGASLPFNPSLTAGTSSIQAGGLSPFAMTMSREDGQQDLQAIELHMPPGLSGVLSGVELCPEAKANAGTCGSNSLIGETVVSVGVGNDPFTVTGGKVYLTGPYRGAPFGLSIVNPAKAGPLDLGQVIVRAKIEVNPLTAALTVTSDNEGRYKIPTMIDGIPLQIKHVNVNISRPGFTFNPTSCEKLAITGTLSSAEGSTDQLSVPFQVTNCARLGFEPSLTAATQAKTSRKNGASLTVHLTYPKESLGKQANVKEVKVELPKALPSRLSTLQKACTAAQFEANPSGCPPLSVVGHAKAMTPIIPVPLEGPAYFVSNAGLRFPELVLVLQGYGITIDLHGETFISKKGVTSSTFKTVPDQPVESFELTLPSGPDSALAANRNLCEAPLTMPTTFVGQNGASFKRATKIAVSGCKPAIHVLKKKTKGDEVTLKLSVPAAGRLTVGGDVSPVHEKLAKAGKTTLKLTLAKKARRVLAAHPKHTLKAKISLRLSPKHGSKLTRTVTVVVR